MAKQKASSKYGDVGETEPKKRRKAKQKQYTEARKKARREKRKVSSKYEGTEGLPSKGVERRRFLNKLYRAAAKKKENKEDQGSDCNRFGCFL